MLVARLLSPTLDMNSIGAGAWKEVRDRDAAATPEVCTACLYPTPPVELEFVDLVKNRQIGIVICDDDSTQSDFLGDTKQALDVCR